METFSYSHIAILNHHFSIINFKKLFDKNELKQIAFFSENTLKYLVEEESKRDTSVIIEREGQSLRTMSSGERKVALLKYLISLEPKSMVVENF